VSWCFIFKYKYVRVHQFCDFVNNNSKKVVNNSFRFGAILTANKSCYINRNIDRFSYIFIRLSLTQGQHNNNSHTFSRETDFSMDDNLTFWAVNVRIYISIWLLWRSNIILRTELWARVLTFVNWNGFYRHKQLYIANLSSCKTVMVLLSIELLAHARKCTVSYPFDFVKCFP
jgi:hypothetical protein